MAPATEVNRGCPLNVQVDEVLVHKWGDGQGGISRSLRVHDSSDCTSDLYDVDAASLTLGMSDICTNFPRGQLSSVHSSPVAPPRPHPQVTFSHRVPFLLEKRT